MAEITKFLTILCIFDKYFILKQVLNTEEENIMANIKTEQVEFKTQKSVQQISNVLRQAADQLKANIEKIIDDDPLGGFDDDLPSAIAVVFSGRLSMIGGLKHFRPGSANNIWGVQVYVYDTKDEREVVLIALGQGVLANGLNSNGSGILNLGASKEKRDAIANMLV
jgi:hypothetical protein